MYISAETGQEHKHLSDITGLLAEQPLSNSNEYTNFKGVRNVRIFDQEKFSQRKRQKMGKVIN